MAESLPPDPPSAAVPAAVAESLPFPLQDSEYVLQVCRKHWWYLWPTLAFLLLAMIVPIIALWLVLDAAGGYEGVGRQIFWVLAAIWVVYWGVRTFLVWYRYKNDVWVVTNQRIVDAYKSTPFSLRVSSADLVNVQDISVQRLGILQTTLDFGDIVCQTSGAREVFRLHGVPDPRTTQALIDRERDRERLRTRG